MTEQPTSQLAPTELAGIERRSVWVFIEHTDGRIADVSLELVGKARDLAGQAGYDVVGLLCGHDVDELAQEVIRHGAGRGPPTGRDCAPRVASALRCGLTADCTDLQIGDYESRRDDRTYTNLLFQIRPAFGGNLVATIVNPNSRPQMATVREGVMRKPAADAQRTGVAEQLVP